ncbi:winged helix-turn-helix domain-containing protein [Streptomyces halobius]|uniref:Winged helix-turn-helix domain-containing protein n=1 Tax=Streptomyces halobius TaxID=2879846 RepID=A0ABY4MNJ2_9ACTN|nr:winged helix-turn-helix domain-containing protein [Streptomyces halobius]UQA98020.1 winged helix-turn-helix domain-containing protein [Streptomyces halobius]
MTNIRTLPATSTTAAVPAHPGPYRHRLRAVAPDESHPSPTTAPSGGSPSLRPGGPPPHHSVQEFAELLNSGATWLPAPQHSLPALPGRPPMVGYLVLVPAEQATAPLPPAVPTVGPPANPAAAKAPAAAFPATATATASPTAPDDALVRVDREQRTAHVQGRPLDLTFLEFELLAHLVAHPHRVHTRDHLVTTVWGYGHVGDGRTVDVHVARLRRKLGAEHRSSIVTVRRVGYKYVPSV